MMKKLLPVTLCAAMLLSCFMTSCTDKPDEPATSDTTDGETTQSVTEGEESETAYGTADDTTEEATTEEVAGPAEPAVTIWPVKAMTFNNKNIQSVSIHASEDICEQYAARELQKYLEKMSIAVKEDGDFPITLQIDPALGDDSYRIETGSSIEDGMAITGGNGRGCYDAPLKAADRARYVAVEETVETRPRRWPATAWNTSNAPVSSGGTSS